MATILRSSRGVALRSAGAVAALFVLLLVLGGGGAAQGAFAVPVKIMPVGDSITDGFNVPGGYRIDLEDDLLAAGASFDFVGSLTNGPASLADREHEGHSGWRIHIMHDAILPWLSAYQPDVVLLMLGTNDVAQDTDLANAPARLGALIDRIHGARPQAHVVVASIPPFANANEDAQARAFNAAIPGLVATRANQGRPVSFADVYSALTPADLADGVHPTATGYSKIADVWRTALVPVLGLGGAPTATLTSPVNGAAYAHDASVPLAATADDPGGSVARVDFLDGATVIGSDSTAPYELTWADPAAGQHTLRARAVDSGGLTGTSAPVSISVAAAPGQVLFRVDAGGAGAAATPAWAADTLSSPSPFVNAGSKTFTTSATISLTHSSLPPGTPEGIFRSERWDPAPAPEMEWTFPVTPGQYEVRLYFAEIYSGAWTVGKRRFDVLVEGSLVLDDYDVFAAAGANRGIMRAFTVTSDSALDVDFRQVAENPALKAIEIVAAGTPPDPPPSVTARSPLDGATGVSVDTVTSATFSEAMDPASISGATFTLAPASAPGSPVPATVTYDGALKRATLDPSAALAADVTYVATVKGGAAGVKDAGGTPMQTDHSWSFRTQAAPSTGEVVYRVNAGGPAIAGSPAWAADTLSSPSPFVNAGSKTFTTSATISLTHSSLPPGTPEGIFRSERWDPAPAPEMEWTFPVTPGQYEVRLYFAEIYSGAWTVGKRRFDVLVEGSLVLDDYDVFAAAGANRGIMRAFTVTSDSALDVDFRQVAENPALKAIEIVRL